MKNGRERVRRSGEREKKEDRMRRQKHQRTKHEG